MLTAALIATTSFSGAPALAKEIPGGVLEELVVYGRAQTQIGTALAASEGMVGHADIRLPPLLRVGELVEAVPGMVATQHSGTGKANQYFLRGFNLDHGTDFSARTNGVPVNLPTHGHGQGYLDLNFMIPELVATTTYRKGPYLAAIGDFSSAGSVDFEYYDRLPESLGAVTLGAYGYRHGLGATSIAHGSGVTTLAVDVTGYDGPWELEENLEQLKLYAAHAFDLGRVRARLAVEGYDGEWNSTDQIPARAVRSGLIGERGFIDPDPGGSTHRYALTGSVEGQAWRAMAYAVSYDLSLYSNFTYLLDDPDAGDQFQQRDRRRIYGMHGGTSHELEFGGRPLVLNAGAELRYDDIEAVGLYGTTARQRTRIVREDAVEQLSTSVFGEARMPVTHRLRAFAGLRADRYDWDVAAGQPNNGGTGDDMLVSPKAGLAYRLTEHTEFYANWGRGFHSNDVRGATIEVDPVTGEPAERVDVLVQSQGAELGARFERGSRFNATLTAFWLELDSELVFVGDAGTTEPNDATRRTGFEAATFLQANSWLAVNAAYTLTDAEYTRNQGAGREIPGAVETVFSLGANAVWPNGLRASARLRYLGEAPLVEDDSIRAEDSLLVNAGLAYRRGPVEYRLEAFNLLDSNDHDISYYYPSRLADEPEEGVADVHFHPLEPRMLRAAVTYHW
jgi:hypothetical protein